MKLKDKVAVITGAGKGIGKSIAEEFALEGAKVCILDFDETAGNETAQALAAKNTEALFVKTDVSNYDSLVAAREKILARFGAVHILVINAGISKKHSIQEISVDEWNQVLNINLNGSFYTLKAFYDLFYNKAPEDYGKVIFITSGSAITGTGGGAHYAATKSGQHGLMRAVSKELGPKGVNVNAIAPRVIVTDLFDTLYPTEESKEDLLSKIPIGRFGYPMDISKMAAFLSSEDAAYIHGQILLLDGGRTY